MTKPDETPLSKEEELMVLDIYCENQTVVGCGVYDAGLSLFPEIQSQITQCESAGATRKEIEAVLKPYLKLT